MLLAIDIGNTNLTIGVFQDDKLKTTWRIATSIHREADEYATVLLALLQYAQISPAEIRQASLCSVVPPLTTTLTNLCQRYFKCEPFVVEAGAKTGIRIVMDNPREVGADRVVNSAAARQMYTGPLIVIDFGTATTFDVVSKEGDYLGGVICPGVVVGAEALFNRTAQLPRIEVARPKKVIGKSTIAAMQSGVLFGYIGLVEGLVARIRAEMGENARVIATGGLAPLIARDTKVIEVLEPDLTLIGLKQLYDLNRGKQ